MRIASLVVALALGSCATEQRHVPLETRLAVDGSGEIAASEADVRAAAVKALHMMGYELVDGADIATKPRVENVPRWQWIEAEHPGAKLVAEQAAVLAGSGADGHVPSSTPDQGPDAAISVAWIVELQPGEHSTTVALHPSATVDNEDVTDRYVNALGRDRFRHRCDEILDAIRAALPSS
jgi:hypothetical protein